MDVLVETAIAEFGVIDILVNNAGIISSVLGRLAEPEEIASIALSLASGASGNITRETIVADSGFLA